MGLLDGVLGGMGEQGLDLDALAGQFGGADLQGIVQQFEQGGLGHVVQSWIASGANLPVSAEQIQSVLGSETVTKLAAQIGIDPSQVASFLPAIVDRLTPNGQLPQGGIGDILGGLLKT